VVAHAPCLDDPRPVQRDRFAIDTVVVDYARILGGEFDASRRRSSAIALIE
jgi:hypothetical protein